MGGGAAMRTASKVAGFGGTVMSGGLRGAAAPAAMPTEQAVRKSSIPVSAMISSSSSSSSGTRVGADVAAVQRPAWEIEGWEFAGVVDDVEAGDRMPRVVFTGVPSFDEAKEATAELKDALDQVYLSSAESSESRELVPANELSGLSVAHVTNGTISAPNHALNAFKLLSTSTEAQNVVASIASDPNVWKAVMHNPVLQEFIESNKTRVEFQETETPEQHEEDSSGKTKPWDFGKWCSEIYNKVKVTTIDFVTFLSSKMNSIFPNDEKENLSDRDVRVASLLGLATLVVMVVLFKRI